VFTESHCIGHQAWHLHDRGHPRFNESDRALVGDPVLDVAVATDRALGEILADVDDDTTVVLLASHGFTAKYVAQFMLPDILLALGVAKRQVSSSDGPVPWKVRQVLDPVLTEIWQRTPQRARNLLEPLRQRTRELVATPPRDAQIPLDPAAGKCFVLIQGNTHGAIRVNLVGREPEGKVNPGAEYEAFIESLTRDLMEIVNVDTGRRIVNRVIRTSDLYRGEGTEHFPDLFVEWTGAEPVRAVSSPRIGRIDKEYSYCRTGEHVQAGVFVAVGPEIAPGRLDREVSILDFAPTFCEALGVHCDQFEGTPIREIVAPFGSRAARSSAAGSASLASGPLA
jgi:predicted AlkP superfamily phosphohydrolase/phosphomutase